jgi:hypothetical protein
MDDYYSPTEAQLAKDWAERRVDFGGYKHYEFFEPRHIDFGRKLPSRPEPAGDQCRCPSCQTQGWLAQSPCCRLWRACCSECGGTRVVVEHLAPGRWRNVPCDLCQEEWTQAVRFFRDALRSPRLTAERLRDGSYGS